MIESGRHRRRRQCSVWLTRCFAWPVGARTVGKDATALEAYLVWLGRAAAPEGGRRRRQVFVNSLVRDARKEADCYFEVHS